MYSRLFNMRCEPFFRRLAISAGNSRPSSLFSASKNTWRTFSIPTDTRSTSSVGETVKGQSGCHYSIQKILQDSEHRKGKVYLASDGTRQVVLKEITENWDYRGGIYATVEDCPNVRQLVDIVPERDMFVFEYLNSTLLKLAWDNLPPAIMKRILKSALNGIAVLHEREVNHNDIKANNIMVQLAGFGKDAKLEKVHVVDLEDALHCDPMGAATGPQLGNRMWRSPEAHAMGPIGWPTDMFSFGLVCIYAMTKILPFWIDEGKLEEGVHPLAVIIERQISYFADTKGYYGFLSWLDEGHKWIPVFEAAAKPFFEDMPTKPFALWKDLDVDQEEAFKDLVVRMMKFDPTERLPARQALEHEWFKDVQLV